jgi:hypothetical protein
VIRGLTAVPAEKESLAGGRLITLSNGTDPGIHVWDLRSIQRELAARGLDWN